MASLESEPAILELGFYSTFAQVVEEYRHVTQLLHRGGFGVENARLRILMLRGCVECLAALGTCMMPTSTFYEQAVEL
jgi:hypothetical protein